MNHFDFQDPYIVEGGSEEDRLRDYLMRFSQQSSLGASGALEQIRLLREVQRQLPSQYKQFCDEIGITPRQEEQTYEIAYRLAFLAMHEKFEREATLFVVGCLTDEEFDDVLLRFIAWQPLDADQLRNNIVAERLETSAVQHTPVQ